MNGVFVQLPAPAREQLLERARGRSVFFPEGTDPRVLAAADILKKDYGVGVQLGTPLTASLARQKTLYAIAAAAQDRGKASPISDDPRASDPFFEGGAALSRGEVDACVGGCVASTAHVIRAALATVGLATPHGLVTSAFLLALREPTAGGESLLVYSDCAVIPQPSSDQLVEIAWFAAQAYEKWSGRTPRVGFLSFSTAGSAEHPDCLKVKQAAEKFRMRHPAVASEGEVQFDAAIVPQVAARKNPASTLKGTVNVFVFPDLDAGNIAYKITERLAGASAWGPVLLGAKLPFSDLSRGASANDIVHSALLTLALAGD